MAGRRTYTLEERVQIVKEHLEEGKTVSELAVEHGLGYRLVYDWVTKYQTKGLAGLEDRRGQRIAEQEPRTPEEELRVRNAQLEREIYLLKMENDLLFIDYPGNLNYCSFFSGRNLGVCDKSLQTLLTR